VSQFVIRYSFLPVNLFNGLRLVFMTPKTGVFNVSLGMACLASYFSLAAMIQGECMVAQFCRPPAVSSMAILTLEPKKTSMDFRFTMASDAVFRGALESFICVAGYAFEPACLLQEDIGVVKLFILSVPS
jgi:hypothetical protein